MENVLTSHIIALFLEGVRLLHVKQPLNNDIICYQPLME